MCKLQQEPTIIQSPDVVRKHPQQVAKADRGYKEGQIEEKEFPRINLESGEKVECNYEDDMLECDER
jgi:hypothetical protein